MKKALIYLLAIAMLIATSLEQTSAQSSLELVAELNKGRQAELSQITFGGKKEIAKINKRYDKLIEKALYQQPQATEADTKRSRKVVGANIDIDGDQGYFSGKSLDVNKGANAFATVVVADANATLIKSLAGNGTVNAGSVKKAGLEGIIANRDRYRDATIIIEGISGGNRFKKTYALTAGQRIKEYLLPGKYRATIQLNGYSNPLITDFDVLGGQNMVHNYQGEDVFFAVWAGNNSW